MHQVLHPPRQQDGMKEHKMSVSRSERRTWGDRRPRAHWWSLPCSTWRPSQDRCPAWAQPGRCPSGPWHHDCQLLLATVPATPWQSSFSGRAALPLCRPVVPRRAKGGDHCCSSCTARAPAASDRVATSLPGHDLVASQLTAHTSRVGVACPC